MTRRMSGRATAWGRAALIALIRAYRATLGGWLGGQCRFSPTCSIYAEEAIRLHGAARGTAMAVWRLARCNPYGRGGLDPVPPAASYDNVIHGDARSTR